MGFGVIRPQAQGLVKMLQGRIKTALHCQRHPQVIMGSGIVRFQPQRFPIMGYSLLGPAEFIQDRSDKDISLCFLARPTASTNSPPTAITAGRVDRGSNRPWETGKS